MTGASYGRLATDRNGRVLLNLPSELRDAGNLRVAAENSQDLVVYQPAAGALPARALFETHSLTLELVPKRSALLSSPAQIRAWIEEGMKAKLENRSLRADRNSLKAAMAKQQEEFRRRWSDATGFTPKEVVEMALGYAKKIQDDPQGSSLLDQAVAAYAQENFQESARLFGKAADEAEVEFQRSQNRAQEIKTELDKAVRESLDALVNTRRRQAAAYRSAFELEKATGALSAALEQIDRTRYRDLWIAVFSDRTEARMDEGTAGSGPVAKRATETAIAELKQLLGELNKDKDTDYWAYTQDDLGNALREQASRMSGPAALELLAQSVAALRAADKIYDDTWLRFEVDDHVDTLRDLGIALRDQAYWSEGSAALVLYAEAVAAFRHALKEYALKPPETKEDLAKVQVNLGIALIEQANHSSGAAAAELYDQGMAAYRSTLEIYTRAAIPEEWADTQRLIGNLLVGRAGQKGEKAPLDLLIQAVAAYRASLEVTTRQKFSVVWALSQEALGLALAQQARYTTGGGTEDLRSQAADAYRAALEVHTREQWPQEWALTQLNLANVLIDQASPLHPDAALRFLTQAADADRAALEVYTRDANPRNWAFAKNSLGVALDRQAGYNFAAGVDLRNQAVAAFRASLEVRTREAFPLDWAVTQSNLGLALGALARGSIGTVALEFAAQAAAAYRAALQLWTREAFPQDWAATQKNLGRLLEFAADWQPAAEALEQHLELYPQDRESIADLTGIYHDYLFNYERAFALQQRNVELSSSQPLLAPTSLLNFAETNLTTARFERCVELLSSPTEKDLIPAFIPVRDSFRFACQVGEGDVRGAILTAQTLLEAGPPVQIIVWSFKGTEHFLSTHTAFGDHREAWVALFRALVSGDGTAFAASVRQLQDALQHR
jgi:hypothetical protein